MAIDAEETKWAWIVALACFCMNFIILGLQRSAAVVYVALLGEFGITREQAAWPITLCSSIMFLVGPLSGFLSNYFAIRTIVFCGCAIAAAGVILCYFGHSLIFVIMFFGAVQGFGSGLIITLNPVIINQYFQKHKASATGFAYSGASIGSMVLPLLTEYFLNEYGLHGCFLLLGGIIMQGLVAASLYRPPKAAAIKTSQARIACSEEHEGLMNQSDTVQVKIMVNESRQPEKVAKNPNLAYKLRNATEVMMHPLFAVICINYTGFFVCYLSYIMVFVDFALDRGISEPNATLCITMFSVGDLIGRLFSGWISDFGYIRTKYFVAINLLGIALCFVLIPVISTYSGIVCWCVTLGVLTGSVLIIFPVLMTEHLGLHRLPMAMGFAGFTLGCTSLALPNLIGLFRDVVGTYDHLFHTLGAVAAFSALLWLIKPLFQLCSKRLRKS